LDHIYVYFLSWAKYIQIRNICEGIEDIFLSWAKVVIWKNFVLKFMEGKEFRTHHLGVGLNTSPSDLPAEPNTVLLNVCSANILNAKKNYCSPISNF